ncbi:MAG: TIGR03084 family metal-binding protein [Hyphomicrobiaceae bacterium]
MLTQIIDFKAEFDELDGVLARIANSDFERTTAFKAWTINDVLRHLHFGDMMAMAALRSTEEFRALRATVQARKAAGLSTRDEARERLGHLGGHALRQHWQRHVDMLCEQLAVRDPEDRIAWAGPDMGLRMFTTARQMETWSHGQEVFDVLGLDRVPTPRLRNIATIGVRTYGWTFANRQLSPPGDPPHVRLQGPAGDIWEWNPPQPGNSVTGSALEFCQVVTQVRNIADTQLVVLGAPATAWMQIAQCFAGPPESPPAPGTRKRAATPVV